MARPPSPLKIPPNCEPSREAFAVVVDDLINDVILDFCFKVHKASKIGLYNIDPSEDDEDGSKLPEDIFGQVKGKLKLPNIHCPNCQKKIEPSRFICHLEKCMGHGRQSGRNARRKMGAMESDCDDDENGSDSSYSSTKKKPKKKTKAATKKRTTKETLGLHNMEGPSMNVAFAYENFKAFLDAYCGVESKHTKKMCMNTINCSAHTKSQKEDIRNKFFINKQKPDDVQIDVDTVDGESGIFMSQDVSRDTTPENELSGED